VLAAAYLPREGLDRQALRAASAPQVDGAHDDECDWVNDRVDVWEE
jgi:hypothetical protein